PDPARPRQGPLEGRGRASARPGRARPMGLIADVGPGPIALDTPVFVYLIQEHPRYLPLLQSLLAGIDTGVWDAVTCGLTVLETVAVPLGAGHAALAERYETVLTRARGLTVVDLDGPLLRAAAHLRARYDIRTPDALQLATAMSTGC